MKIRNLKALIVAIILCEILGALGTIFTAPNIPTWYAILTKPFFSPPNWVFGPVWTTLFFLIGVALYIIWENSEKKKAKERKFALMVFGVQFLFNILWSGLFFGLKSPLLGLVGIIFLWLSIAWTIILFYNISKKSAYLLVPYILWVSFATILNLAIFLLNP